MSASDLWLFFTVLLLKSYTVILSFKELVLKIVYNLSNCYLLDTYIEMDNIHFQESLNINF
jgi:hypothetical protein